MALEGEDVRKLGAKWMVTELYQHASAAGAWHKPGRVLGGWFRGDESLRGWIARNGDVLITPVKDVRTAIEGCEEEARRGAEAEILRLCRKAGSRKVRVYHAYGEGGGGEVITAPLASWLCSWRLVPPLDDHGLSFRFERPPAPLIDH